MWRVIFSFAVGYMVGHWGKAWLDDQSGKIDEDPAEPPIEPPVESVSGELEGDEVAELKETADEFDPSKPADDLTRIKGVGKVFAQRLAEGGITRYAQLAAADAAVVYELLAVKPWQKVDIAAWQEQAKQFVGD